VASCSSRDWRRSACEMLICTSSPLSLDTSSSRCLSVACTPSSEVRCCWSWPSASSCAMRSRSSAARASMRAARSCCSWPSASWRAARSCWSRSSAAVSAAALSARAVFSPSVSSRAARPR
jgi:hypothetical protein